MILVKRLKDNKALIKSANYPKVFSKNCKRNVALIGIGGNIGNTICRFEKLLIKLKQDRLVKILSTSIIFKNPPFGYKEQNYFYNSLILIDTNLSATKLLKYMLKLEKFFKRKRSFKNAPRTLDLDIIFYKKHKIKSKDLTIPHPHWKERESVILPLMFLKGNRCLQKVL